jgi:hypothetical protein
MRTDAAEANLDGRNVWNKNFFVPHILHNHQYISEASPSIGEIWPSLSRVECHSEFEPAPDEALLKSEILFLETLFVHCPREKRRSALDPRSKVNKVGASDSSPPDTVSLSLQHVAWHCQRVPLIAVDLLRREDCPSLEEYEQYDIDCFTSVPWAEQRPG